MFKSHSRMPVLSYPTMWPLRFIELALVWVGIEINSLPCCLLSKNCMVLAMPIINWRFLFTARTLAFFSRIMNIVISFIIFANSGQGKLRRLICIRESFDIHVPQIHRGFTRHNPFGNYFANTTSTSNSMCTKTCSDIETANRALA